MHVLSVSSFSCCRLLGSLSRKAASAVRAERWAGAGSKSVLLYFPVRGGFADSKQLRGGENASSCRMEGFFQRGFFKCVEVEGFGKGKGAADLFMAIS